MMTDIAIRNALILDGSGAEGFEADIAISGGMIESIGTVGACQTEINGEGLTLAPGLIDTHAHDDGAFLRHPDMTFKLSQGVTTVVSGNCGFSAIPFDPDADARAASGGILSGLGGNFTDLSGYFDAVLEAKPAINNMMLVGHNTVRSLAVSDQKRAPSEREMQTMQGHVEQALEQGPLRIGRSEGSSRRRRSQCLPLEEDASPALERRDSALDLNSSTNSISTRR